jgi:hypothetical protein
MGAFRWGQEHDVEYLSSAMSVFAVESVGGYANQLDWDFIPAILFQRIRRKSQQVGLGPVENGPIGLLRLVGD